MSETNGNGNGRWTSPRNVIALVGLATTILAGAGGSLVAWGWSNSVSASTLASVRAAFEQHQVDQKDVIASLRAADQKLQADVEKQVAGVHEMSNRLTRIETKVDQLLDGQRTEAKLNWLIQKQVEETPARGGDKP